MHTGLPRLLLRTVTKMASAAHCPGEFPHWGLLPRKETGVASLLAKQPTFDGRGVVIAIFDTGVDPGAPGLQTTTENKVKIIDRIDASGAGDVDTSTVVEATEGVITGLSGRKLKIPVSWVNPSGKYHIGIKGAYALYPQRLRERMSKEQKEKHWDLVHKELVAEAQRKLQALESSKNNSGGGSGSNGGSNNGGSGNLLEKMEKEDTEARVALLNMLEKKYNDLGPAYDCVVYNDGQQWRACIDTSESGELGSGVHLGEYRLTHQWAPLTSQDCYNISINIHNNGNVLEIVGMCSSHGTHVASIAAANFPDNPERNGVAPGAQIVSITIGDNRINSMETGTALARAMMRVMENPHYKVDVINMSYGEHAHWSDSGRLGKLAEEVVNKYGVLWVASGGNHGPALATVGVPPDFQSDCIIGVGAYVSPDMMLAEYSMVEKLPGCAYTWSSRGPTADGGRGVTVCAPGAAITSVPTFTLRSNQLMNGSSMASPHTAGCVALVLSALKLKSIPYSPYSVRRSIQNSAQKLDVEVFAQGHGLIQVERALEHALQHHGGLEDKIRFLVECGSKRKKGIHIRNWKADKPIDVSVMVEPVLLNDSLADPQEKLGFCMEFVLTCDAPWVKAPTCLQMSYTTRSFQVSIDPRGLERGRVYFSAVQAYDSTNVEKGPMFEVPITIVVPITELTLGSQYSCPAEVFRAGHIRRHFLYVPLESTWATVTLKASRSDKSQRFTLHTVQLKPKCCVKTLEYYKVVNVGCDEVSTHVMGVRGGYTMELCLARWWSSLVDGEVEVTVDFHSLRSSMEKVTLFSCEGVQRVDVQAGGQRSEELSPQASLRHHTQVLTPSESKVEVLGGERDTIPGSRPVYQLVLSYSLTVPKAAEVTPRCALLCEVLYESAFESQLWMLYNHNKQLLGCGDAYYSKYSLKLEKGDYTLRMHVRHERPDLLEKLSDLPMTIITKLAQEVKLDIYSSYNAAVTAGKKAQPVCLSAGTSQELYVAAPSLSDKTLKGLGLTPGQALLGTLSFAKDEQVRKADQYPLHVVVTELPCKKRSAATTTSSSTSEEKKETKTNTDYQEALRDMQTTWIAKLDAESGEQLHQEVIAAHPDHVAAHLSRLQALDAAGPLQRAAVVAQAAKIIAAIDTAPLLAFYGTKTDSRPDAAKIKTQMDKQRNTVLEALSRQGVALCADLPPDPSPEALEQLDNIAIDILKFVEPTDSKVSNFFVSYYKARGLDGLCARLLGRQCEEKWTREAEAKLTEAYTRLGWVHAASFLSRTHPLRFPPAFTLF